MDGLFGNKLEFYGSEYEHAQQVGIFRNRTEIIQHQFHLHRCLEERLNEHNPDVWREALEPFTVPLLQTDLHKLWGLRQAAVNDWFKIVCRAYPKVRTLVLHGTSNAGKSLLANALLLPVAPALIQRDGGSNVHWLENLHRKSIVLWEEPSIHMSNIEDCKLIFGGERIVINRKNKPLIDRPPGPAVVVTTNAAFWEYGAGEPIRNRLHIYHFHKPVESVTKQTLNLQDIATYLCQVYDGEFEPWTTQQNHTSSTNAPQH